MFDWPPTAPVQSLGVTVCADGQIYQAPFIPRSLDGRTGRGDTCFVAYVGQRLSTSPQEAARFAAAVTTLKQEQRGPLTDVAAVLASRNHNPSLFSTV